MAYGFSLFAHPHQWLALVTVCRKETSVQEGVPRYEDLHHFKKDRPKVNAVCGAAASRLCLFQRSLRGTTVEFDLLVITSVDALSRFRFTSTN